MIEDLEGAVSQVPDDVDQTEGRHTHPEHRYDEQRTRHIAESQPQCRHEDIGAVSHRTCRAVE